MKVDIDTDYKNKDIDYYDYIRHSDSEAWKIAAEIMQLDWSYFINIEKDSPEIEFNKRIQRTESYTLMSFKNCFHLRRFKIYGENHEVERYVLMEWN